MDPKWSTGWPTGTENRTPNPENEQTRFGESSDHWQAFLVVSFIMAFRILVDDVDQCYKSLGYIHAKYPNVMGRFKDYISTKKKKWIPVNSYWCNWPI